MLNTSIAQLKNTIRDHISADIMNIVYQERWLQIWVPKQYKGLGLNFKEGLTLLQQLAAIDGSLGWMVTLCAGANYFSRNLQPEIALSLFEHERTCFGGSGMIGGTAEKSPNGFIISGEWKYATGAVHLSNFTLNASVTENGIALFNPDGTPLVRSFVLNKKDVNIIPDWQSMGMKATSTYSFMVDNVWVDEAYSFEYNVFYTDNMLDKIPFRIFADLTLLVNYIGMANHFIEETKLIHSNLEVTQLSDLLNKMSHQTLDFADQVEDLLSRGTEIETLRATIHNFGIRSVELISQNIIQLYTQLGIIASHEQQPINRIFRDYFTATQHANFRR